MLKDLVLSSNMCSLSMYHEFIVLLILALERFLQPVLEQLAEKRTQSGLAQRTHLYSGSGSDTGGVSTGGGVTSDRGGSSGGPSPRRSRAPVFVPLQHAALSADQ